MIWKTSLLCAVVSFSSWASAEEEPHPIDVAMEEAQEENPSTAGMVEAIAAADKKWSALMKKALAKIEKTATPEEVAALEESQAAWEAFKESERKTQAEIYSRMEGTMWRPVATLRLMEITKTRALQLSEYASDISER